MILKRIPDKLKAEIEQLWASIKGTNPVLSLSTDCGMGKTSAALFYCAENSESLYFSFRNVSANFTVRAFSERYPNIFCSYNAWSEFFDSLRIYAKEKQPTVFFDDVGERNDKVDFYVALIIFLEEADNCGAIVVLINIPWRKSEYPAMRLP